MKKIEALDFLNKQEFDVDVVTEDGSTLHSCGDLVSAEVLLKLYFKDIRTPVIEESKEVKVVDQEAVEEVAEEITLQGTGNWKKDDDEFELSLSESKNEATDEQISVEKSNIKEEEILDAPTPDKIAEDDSNIPSASAKDDVSPPLEFDKEHALRVQELSVELGKVLQFSDDKLEDLSQAAYYHDIGRKHLRESDLKEPDFKNTQGLLSMKIIKEEMDLPEYIALVATQHLEPYDYAKLDLQNDSMMNTPLPHVVSLANYFDELIQSGYSQDQAARKILRFGGNRFNSFILHKFINLVRNK